MQFEFMKGEVKKTLNIRSLEILKMKMLLHDYY